MWIGLFAWFTSVSLPLKYMICCHDDVIKWKHFPRDWPFVRTGEFPAQRLVTRSFGVFFDMRPNKRLSKESRGWWFEPASRPLWRHSNVVVVCEQLFFFKSKIHNQSCMLLAHTEAILHPSLFRDSHYKDIDSYYKDKTVMRPSYLFNGNTFADKMAYSNWNKP